MPHAVPTHPLTLFALISFGDGYKLPNSSCNFFSLLLLPCTLKFVVCAVFSYALNLYFYLNVTHDTPHSYKPTDEILFLF